MCPEIMCSCPFSTMDSAVYCVRCRQRLKNPGNTVKLVVQMLLMWVLSTEESSSFGFSTNIAEAAELAQTGQTESELTVSKLAPPAGQEAPAAAEEPPSTNDEIRMPLCPTVLGRRSQSNHLPSTWITNGQKRIFNKSWCMDGRKCLEYSVAADAAFRQKFVTQTGIWKMINVQQIALKV